MTASSIIRAFDRVALTLFHSVIILGLGAVALGAATQSFIA